MAQTLRYTKAALVIQKTYRMLVDRHVFLLVRQATITIQAFVRGTLTRRHYRRVRVLSSDYVLIQTQRLSILMGGGNADIFA